MTDSKPVKILTLGAGIGYIRDLIAKITAINAKNGPFDFALCIGDFFGLPEQGEVEKSANKDIDDFLQGNIEVPVECYLMQGEYPLPDAIIEKFRNTGGELCKNVFLLNKSGLLTTSRGLRVACLGGIYDPTIYSSSEVAPGFSSPFYTAHTVQRLLSNTLTKPTMKDQSYSSLSAIATNIESSQPVDVLITNSWPSSITDFSSIPLPYPDVTRISAPPLDDVITRIKPRYHFAAGGGMFWEREPFVWDDEAARISRFISLGPFGGEPVSGKKQRWFYAFSIAPYTSTTPPPPRPPNATMNPLVESSQHGKRPIDASSGENFIFGNVHHPGKRSRVGTGDGSKPPPGYKCKRCDSTEHFINDCPERTKPPEGYVCRICNVPGHLVRDCPTRNAVGDTGGRKPKEGYVCRACGSEAHYISDCPVANSAPTTTGRGDRRAPPKEISPDECWFCLSNPNLAKHLIVSIGDECYLTLPKGQIIPTQSAIEKGNVAVPGGGHVLIVPITHYPTLNSIPSDLSKPILEETDKYKSSLRAMFAKYGCVAVFFEIGRLSAKGGHAHVHAVPVPRSIGQRAQEFFVKEGEPFGIDFEESEGIVAPIDSNLSYFKVDLPNGKCLLHLMRERKPFSVQFGRQVMVSLLGTPQRLDWKACMLSEDEDKADAQEFKQAFAPFDPTLS